MGKTQERDKLLEGLEDRTRGTGFTDEGPVGQTYVIGIAIDDYVVPHTSLNNAKHDFEAFAEVLVDRYGIPAENFRRLYDGAASRGGIFDLIKELKAGKLPADTAPTNNFPEVPLTPDDSLIIFFAGHGHLNPDTREGYWIPSDKTETYDYISNVELGNSLHLITTKHILLISDACFSGSMLSPIASQREKLGNIVDSEQSRWVITAGDHDEKVSDGHNGAHSPFTLALLKALKSNYRKRYAVVDLFRDIQSKMTAGGQSPVAGAHPGDKHKKGFQMTLHLQKEGVNPRQLRRALMKLDFQLQQNGFDEVKGNDRLFNTVIIKGTELCGHHLLVNRLRGFIRRSKASSSRLFTLANKDYRESKADSIWTIIKEGKDTENQQIIRDVIKDLTEKHVFFFLTIHPSFRLTEDKLKNLITDFWGDFHEQFKTLKELDTTGTLIADEKKALEKGNRFFFFVLDMTRQPLAGLAHDASQQKVWVDDRDHNTMSICLPTIQPLKFGKVETWFLTICPEEEEEQPEVEGDLFKSLGDLLEEIIPRNEEKFVKEVISNICGYLHQPDLHEELFKLKYT